MRASRRKRQYYEDVGSRLADSLCRCTACCTVGSPRTRRDRGRGRERGPGRTTSCSTNSDNAVFSVCRTEASSYTAVWSVPTSFCDGEDEGRQRATW